MAERRAVGEQQDEKNCIAQKNMLYYIKLNIKDDDEEKYMLSDSQREDGRCKSL